MVDNDGVASGALAEVPAYRLREFGLRVAEEELSNGGNCSVG